MFALNDLSDFARICLKRIRRVGDGHGFRCGRDLQRQIDTLAGVYPDVDVVGDGFSEAVRLDGDLIKSDFDAGKLIISVDVGCCGLNILCSNFL